MTNNISNIYPKPSSGVVDERLAVSSTVVTLAASGWDVTNTKQVLWDVQTNDIMVTFDGSDPSASNGHRLYVGQSGTWSLQLAKAARFIRQSADAVFQATPTTV